jgi:D-alanyl-D-alanine carboxypeptidase (penicillin-binding protein 5/6)
VTGTKANLKSGDMLTLEQLYYGMMLPSGNDAALVIADYFGKILA